MGSDINIVRKIGAENDHYSGTYRRLSLDTITCCDFNSLLVGTASLGSNSYFIFDADNFLLLEEPISGPAAATKDGCLIWFVRQVEKSEEDDEIGRAHV